MEKEDNKPRPPKTQPKVENKEEKFDSIFVAKELIIGDQQKIGKWLFEVRQFKNPNYEKFTAKIHDNLKTNNFTFSMSVERFIAISRSANQQNTTGHQMTSIFNGFAKFWQSNQTNLQTMEHLFHHYEQLFYPISKVFVSFCREFIQKRFDDEQYDNFEKTALEMTHKFIETNRSGEQFKAMPLIYQFSLYQNVSLGKLVEIVLRQQNIKEFIYIFTDLEGQLRFNLIKMFIDRCVDYDSKNDFAKCQKVIRELNLDPLQYPNYIRRLQQKYMAYQLRTNKLYYIQLVINHDIQLIEVLIDELKRQRRIRQWKYFIVKYRLEKQYNCNFDPRQRQQLKNIKNVLLDCDEFGPTEVQVTEEEQFAERYLYLRDFGLNEETTIFLNSQNIKQIKLQQEFALKKVGIDSERAGGVHVFDPSDTEILQIYTGKRVLIFDYKDLKANRIFKEIMVYIFTNCKVCGQDIQKQVTQFQKQLQLEINQKIIQQLMAKRILECGKLFKKTFPKETKSNLAYMCQHVFKKTLSKYEQCSGWKSRPLRRAQLHYAALDCVVPYVLCQELQKICKK